MRLGGTVFVSKRLKQKQFGTTAKKVKKSVYRDSLLWFTWFQLRARLPETNNNSKTMKTTKIKGYEVEVELDGETTQCWVFKGKFSASLASLHDNEVLVSNTGAEHKVNSDTIDEITDWAFSEGY